VTTPEVMALVRADGMPKADVLATARIAGIQGAKRTSELIPLCHPIALSSITVDFYLDDDSIEITATAKTTGQTGVEMEALTAVTIAGLTLHDMTKAVDPQSVLGEIQLIEKTGGKSRPEVVPGTAAVLVASTQGAAGAREDTTGPAIAEWLRERGYEVEVTVVADADVAAALPRILAAGPAIVITTGGTGMSPTDRTPEATRPLLDRELPGIAEAIRSRGLPHTPKAALSRGLAGTSGDTVIVNLPGSPGGVKDGLAVLDELLEHLVAQVAGGGPH
jgi:cyclic pyranopterin phosphate synthase